MCGGNVAVSCRAARRRARAVTRSPGAGRCRPVDVVSGGAADDDTHRYADIAHGCPAHGRHHAAAGAGLGQQLVFGVARAGAGGTSRTCRRSDTDPLAPVNDNRDRSCRSVQVALHSRSVRSAADYGAALMNDASAADALDLLQLRSHRSSGSVNNSGDQVFRCNALARISKYSRATGQGGVSPAVCSADRTSASRAPVHPYASADAVPTLSLRCRSPLRSAVRIADVVSGPKILNHLAKPGRQRNNSADNCARLLHTKFRI